jgi:hypothetical protein
MMLFIFLYVVLFFVKDSVPLTWSRSVLNGGSTATAGSIWRLLSGRGLSCRATVDHVCIPRAEDGFVSLSRYHYMSEITLCRLPRSLQRCEYGIQSVCL